MPHNFEGEIRPIHPQRPQVHQEQPASGKVKDTGSSPRLKAGETVVVFQPFTKQTIGGMTRDETRWPETGGFPPIMGGSGQEVNGLRKLRPVKEIAGHVGLSVVRIRALLSEGKVAGEFHKGKGTGPGMWYTTEAAVLEYKKNLPTPSDFGKIGGPLGGRIAGRGRPKSKP